MDVFLDRLELSGLQLSLHVPLSAVPKLPGEFWVPLAWVDAIDPARWADALNRQDQGEQIGWVCFRFRMVVKGQAAYAAIALRSASGGSPPPQPVVTSAEWSKRGAL
ncbi:MAG: hypothetical protein ACRCSX_07610 [Allorhizobium sp.]